MSTKPNPRDHVPYENLKIFISSAIAGATSRCATAPLDRLKILFQTQQSIGADKKYDGIVKSFMRIKYEDGIAGYWRGNFANVVKVVPEIGSRFLMFEYIKSSVIEGRGEVGGELKGIERFLSGGFAGVISQFIVYPMEVIRARLIVSEKAVYNGIIDCARSTYKSGPKNFYRGLFPSLLGIFPYAATDLAIYDFLRSSYIKKHGTHPDPVYSLMSGAISSSIGQFSAYPLDLTRRRLQIQGINSKVDNPLKYTGMVDCLQKTISNEGIRGLYKGMTPNLLKVVPAVSIYYMVYEQIKKYYHIG